MGEWDTELILNVWEKIGQEARFDYRVGHTAQRALREILRTLPADFFKQGLAQLNVSLREKLAPELKAGGQRSRALARWVIRDWGGIKTGNGAIDQWIECLGDFSDKKIERFIADNGTARISSWSKLPAFARHDSHAIYDTRTAVALNCALRMVGDIRQFFMPVGQNAVLMEARLKFKRLHPLTGNISPLGYLDYIDFLKKVVESKCSPCLLRAEMALFANAPRLGLLFLEDRVPQLRLQSRNV